MKARDSFKSQRLEADKWKGHCWVEKPFTPSNRGIYSEKQFCCVAGDLLISWHIKCFTDIGYVFCLDKYLQGDLGHLWLCMQVKHVQGSSCGIHTCQYPLGDHCAAGLYVGEPWSFDRDLKTSQAKALDVRRLLIIFATNLYTFQAETTSKDYLLHYLTVLHTVSDNCNVGMRNNSQCIYLTISTRIHRLVIHSFTVESKNRQLYSLMPIFLL